MRALQTGVLALALLVSGCGMFGKKTGACDSEETLDAVTEAMQKEVAGGVRPATGSAQNDALTPSRIKAAARAIRLTLSEIRTTRDGGSKSATTCKAVALVKLPANLVENADAARASAKLSTVVDHAKDFDVDHSGSGWKSDLEFTVQRTDDSNKPFAEVAQDQSLITFLSDLVQSSLTSGGPATAGATPQDAAARETQTASAQAVAAQVEEARVQNRIARDAINATWTSVPEVYWGDIAPLQRAWVKRKQADCNLEATKAAVTDPQQKALAFLRCDTRMTTDRTKFLQQNLPDSGEDDSTG